jgi:glyoxalase family protein
MSIHLLGLHHVTAIAADAKKNFDFYTRVLGLRLVKKTVNFDDPAAYHLYYGDYAATPGAILTFFFRRGVPRGRVGPGQAGATAFSVPDESMDFWHDRLQRLGVNPSPPQTRFGQPVVTFADPDGLKLELVGTSEPDPRRPVLHPEIQPAQGIRGFHGVTLDSTDADQTAKLLTDTMGYRFAARDGRRTRYTIGDGRPGTFLDLDDHPGQAHGQERTGTVHHVAFRTPDDRSQEEARRLLGTAGYAVSPVMDRNYFHSIYYREPGGILFEIATDPPGFAVDEPVDQLGASLKLPAWYEPRRALIEARLPKLDGL